MIPTQVTPNRQNYVEIGKIYENLVTEVVFSVPDLGDGTGSYTVVFQRPKEAAPYPVAARVEWPNVIWEVGAADTAKSGTGKAEVRWYGDDGEVGKSKTFIVRVNAGLADPTEAPEAWEGYVGRVARNAETAETAAADAAASAQSAGADAVKAEAALKALEDGIASGDFRGEDGAVPDIQIGTVTTLPAGSDATASMGGTAENPLLNLGIPKGADGQGSGSGGTDISLGLTSATVGQTIKVKAVDADGKPTEWEAADFQSGESTAGDWEEFMRFTVDNAETVMFDFSSNGIETLESKKVKQFYLYSPSMANTGCGKASVFVNDCVKIVNLNDFGRASAGSCKLVFIAGSDTLDVLYFGRDSENNFGMPVPAFPIVSESSGILTANLAAKNAYKKVYAIQNGVPFLVSPVDYIKKVTVTVAEACSAGVEFIVYVR